MGWRPRVLPSWPVRPDGSSSPWHSDPAASAWGPRNRVRLRDPTKDPTCFSMTTCGWPWRSRWRSSPGWWGSCSSSPGWSHATSSGRQRVGPRNADDPCLRVDDGLASAVAVGRAQRIADGAVGSWRSMSFGWGEDARDLGTARPTLRWPSPFQAHPLGGGTGSSPSLESDQDLGRRAIPRPSAPPLVRRGARPREDRSSPPCDRRSVIAGCRHRGLMRSVDGPSRNRL
ncbi:MAG: hypothetical protein QOH37_3543 [Nocardioidaceae bacterium]|jgi:hypothetical protein|nr:hypothetical protein [Nocardioidaceae bacterium]